MLTHLQLQFSSWHQLLLICPEDIVTVYYSKTSPVVIRARNLSPRVVHCAVVENPARNRFVTVVTGAALAETVRVSVVSTLECFAPSGCKQGYYLP